ncbi:hypothetical protein AZI86_05215 [Bdellovibrio bacteriovorus]|uniref:CBM-cenC domain-containing protein n=1 Tax=Bdellovibrio bacteriovorus TaxID=959 RepID=A0A150WQ63_BDEBC|nr:carbohydrate binding domain-containing protein [Bdellovibrio bacteriovorus]KYG66447.1 hypothetical protein AZI86_05215 [Bdellovibrio bacteriovorus]
MVKFLAASLFLANIAYAQINVSVNSNTTITEINANPVGMVLNQMNDGTLSQSSLTTAVQSTGSKRLRFPEGETADNYYFTDPAYISAPRPSTHRVANTSWYPANSSLANSAGVYSKGLNFDQFMAVANAAKAIPNVVLCYPCTDKAKALEMAKAWVKYAKDKGYKVGQWEIGNETYIFNSNYTDVYQMSVSEYAKDVIEWSQALKAIDPSIKLGANGETTEWFYSLLTYKHPTLNIYAAQALDFLVVHSYQQYGSNFANYQANKNSWGTLDYGASIKSVENALSRAQSVVNTSHLRLSMTETSSMNFSSNDPNNLGSALMTVEILLEALKYSRLDYVELWASRWINNFSAKTPQASDTFSSTNKLNASGTALALVSKFVGNRAVYNSGSTTTLRVFSQLDSATNMVNVILVNRASSAQTVALNIQGKTSAFSGTLYKLTGKSTDTAPALSSSSNVSSSSATLSISVPATSVYVIQTSAPAASQPAPNLVLNPSFESSLTSWGEDWGNSSVVANASAGSYGLRIGTAAGGRAQVLSGLVAGKTYKLSVYGKLSAASSEYAWAGVKFRDASGKDIAGASYTVLVTGTTYQKYEVIFTAPSSFSSAVVWGYKNAGSAYLHLDDFSLTAQ